MRKISMLIWLVVIGAAFAQPILAQNAALTAALDHVENNLDQYDLTLNDIQDYVITDQYQNQKNKATYLYLRQRYQGVEVYNAIMSITLDKNNQVIFIGNRFVRNLQTKINGTTPSLTPVEATKKAVEQLDINLVQDLEVLQTIDDKNYVISKSGISKEDIPVKLMLQPIKDGTVKLVWDLSIYTLDAQNWWSVRVDAASGDILNKTNWITHCKHGTYTNHSRVARQAQHVCEDHISKENQLQNTGSYRIFDLPLESPIHGNRTLVASPNDSLASPYGWHDTNGSTGAEYTITRGNNVHAYQDTANNNSSIGDEPDGGMNLLFDFPVDLTQEPNTYRDAAITNLFYWNNLIHDVWYHYGFDEAAGNFQENNYGRGGAQGDAVNAEGHDGSGTNNANFATPPDGSSGRMQMYLWDNIGGNILNVNNGSATGGYEVEPAAFGATIDTIGVTGDLVVVDDGTLNGSQGCNALVNANDVNGKIAIIDRGSCEFGLKSLNAQNAGAIAVIVCNNQPGLVSMGAGAVGGQVTIPCIFLGQSDCQAIKVSLQTGPISATIKLPNASGPAQLDASFDNGVMAHEYGHGISNRLTAGPSNVGCLTNQEQQGEGWSDWFALVMTVEPGDFGTDKRGMGVYVNSQGVDGGGIRSTPYSTDFGLNPKTMNSMVLESIPHGVGSIWASAIWDLYWKMVDVYGYDPDIYHGTGGNNMAMQLVMDGMKMQACDPSFIDARDAIFAADVLNYNGANECLLWEVFAKRGLGFSATAGNKDNVNDNVEAFDLPNFCRSDIFISKTAIREVEAGSNMTYNFEVTNYSADTLTNVVITDTLESNLFYVSGSSTCTATDNGQIITINLGTMLPNDVINCSFDVQTAFAPSTNIIYIDSVEDATTSNNDWLSVATTGTDSWIRVQTNANSGSWAWFAPNSSVQSDNALTSVNTFTITGTRPALRLFHDYDIEPATDAGMIEISDDFTNWADIGQYAISGKYDGNVNSAGLTIAPGRRGFYGSSGGYQETLIDLTDFIGQDLYFRFRMVSDDNGTNNNGWYIDDISLVDLVITPNVAHATSDQNVNAIGEVAEGGTIIMPFTNTNTEEILPTFDVNVYPNPTDYLFNIELGDVQTGDMNIRILGMDGRVMLERRLGNAAAYQNIPVNVNHLVSGIYIIEMKMEGKMVTKKLVIKK